MNGYVLVNFMLNKEQLEIWVKSEERLVERLLNLQLAGEIKIRAGVDPLAVSREVYLEMIKTVDVNLRIRGMQVRLHK